MFIINGETWYLYLVSPNHPMLRRTDGYYTIGSCVDTYKTIYIVNNLPDLLFKKVLNHELTHAVMFSYNIHLNIEQEEIFADLIATYGELILNLANIIFNAIKNNQGVYQL